MNLRKFYVVLTTLCHRSQIGVGPTERVSGVTRTDIARLPLRQPLSFFFVVLTGVDLKFVFMF